MLEMHQPPSKGERTAARLPSLSQQGRERQKQQPGHNPAAPSESAGEGRKFLREAARQAGRPDWPSPHTKLLPCSEEHKTCTSRFEGAGGDDNGSRGGSHSQALDTVLCVRSSSNSILGRGCWLTSLYSRARRSSKSSGPEQPCCWTPLLTCELCVLIQPLHHGDLSSPCHLKQPS